MKDEKLLTQLKESLKQHELYVKCMCDTGGFLIKNKEYFVQDITEIGDRIYLNTRSELNGLIYCIDFFDDDFVPVIK